MLEEYSEVQLAEQFECLLAFRMPKDEFPAELCADLHIVEQLKNLSLGSESQVQVQLRDQLIQKMRGKGTMRRGARSVRDRSIGAPRIWISATLVMFFLLLFVSNTTVSATIGRWLGYGYLPYAGFISLSNTAVIQGPVSQSAEDWSLTILQGVREPEHTILWVDTNLPVATFSEAELVLADGTRLFIQSMERNQGTIRLIFDSFSEQTSQTDLSLPDGWRLPVIWIAADQAGLEPTQVSTPFGDQTNSPCVNLEQDTQICVQAAFTDVQGTHLLLQASRSGHTIPLAWNAQSNWHSITLEDPSGQLYEIQRFEQNQTQDPSVLSMRFSKVPAEVNVVTLHLPIQVLTLPDSIILHPIVVDLPLHLPDRVPVRSPTPGVILTEPDRPIAVPTPAVNRPPVTNTQP